MMKLKFFRALCFAATFMAATAPAQAAGPAGIVEKLYVRPAPGAVPVSYADKFTGQPISIKDFGASPAAPAAVNTAAIQKAIDAARKIGDGFNTSSSGRVYAPSGVYKVNGPIKLYNGTFLDGEAAGAVIFEQQDATKNTFENVDQVTYVDNTLTIKRVNVKYVTRAANAGVYAFKIASSTAIAPVFEDVTVFNAPTAFYFELTINLSMNRTYSINAALDAYVFGSTGPGGVFHNSAANIVASYAAGSGGAGFSGTLIGSTLAGVAADRNGTGFQLRLMSSSLAGSAEGNASFGVQLTNSEASAVRVYVVGAVGAAGGIWLADSKNITLLSPVVEWGGAGTGYGLRTSGTTKGVTVFSPSIQPFAQGAYNDASVLTFIDGPNLARGLLPSENQGAFASGFSAGSGAGGATGTAGFRVAGANGYGVSLEAWDDSAPRWGLFGFSGTTRKPIIEGLYLSNDIQVNGAFVLKSPNGTKYRIRVTDAGVLTGELAVE
ncbi:glycosyl hydrolase family 28-related protein [Massilia sp. GCM10023247]|uniref:glycosyl hydrolase family 28-related protein n=1 Tax=Massilia sp. GCM10023247 TaxID=3252643 RepID=UPI00361DDB25